MTLDSVLATYGNPNDAGFEAANIVAFPLPYPLICGTAMVTKSRCHRLAVAAFTKAFQLIKDRSLIERATHYGGIFAVRNIRGVKGVMSAHSWGCAVDLNPAENALGTAGHMDPGVVACFAECGFTWGGDFHGRKDPMHFSLLGF